MIKLELEKILKERGKSFYWLAQQTGINHSVLSKLRHTG
jgi:DNA-binding Xre family transcriptional regulator